MFRKVLIANRGEIAIRIARTLREMGIAPVTVYTDTDRSAYHVRCAAEAYALGAEPRAYLDIERILGIARTAGCDALHPGYGFLSENPELAKACEQANITFIGPPASAIAAMGSKQRARKLMQQAGVPIVPGGEARNTEEAIATARALGYPVLIKASEGGGGKGMRRVATEAELPAALERTRSEAKKAFGSDRVYLEKVVTAARHVEIQVLGDQDGTTVHLFERDCSLQRRHQKIVEETPCPILSPETLAAMGDVAVRGARAIGYFSAGTFEFLLGQDQSFYFLEMNTRLQVEHPITELITGVDLVREMVRIAAGLPLETPHPTRHGAAIEVRIYAEDPESNFLPSPGRIEQLRLPAGPWVRNDSGVEAGSIVSAEYDPMLSKLAVWAPNRTSAIRRMQRALEECIVTGITTNIDFLSRLFTDADFMRGCYDTHFVETRRSTLLNSHQLETIDQTALAAALAALAEQSARNNPNPNPINNLSPWVHAHRARLRD